MCASTRGLATRNRTVHHWAGRGKHRLRCIRSSASAATLSSGEGE